MRIDARKDWPWAVSIIAITVGAFLVGLTAASDADPHPDQFVPSVQDAYPETDGHAEDLLGYGYAVCAGLDDGRSEAQVADWLSDVPHEHLGIYGDADEFSQAVVGLAVELLCTVEG